MPFISDTANDLYGSSQTSSICGGYDIELEDLQEGGIASYIQSQSGNTFDILISDSSKLGINQVEALYLFHDYLHADKPYPFEIIVYAITIPTYVN